MEVWRCRVKGGPEARWRLLVRESAGALVMWGRPALYCVYFNVIEGKGALLVSL